MVAVVGEEEYLSKQDSEVALDTLGTLATVNGGLSNGRCGVY